MMNVVKIVRIDNDSSISKYYEAINAYLASNGNEYIMDEPEHRLVKTMYTFKVDYVDCAETVLALRD